MGTFKVSHVNEGPAPFDVTASDDEGVELRLRFPDEHPGLYEGSSISVSYTKKAPPEPAPVDDE